MPRLKLRKAVVSSRQLLARAVLGVLPVTVNLHGKTMPGGVAEYPKEYDL